MNNEYENLLKELCEKARSEYQRLSKLFFDVGKPDFGTPINEEQAKQFSVLSKLAAIALIEEYDQISVSQQRGFETTYRMTFDSWGQPSEIKPSGQKSASIRLWSGMKAFTENVQKMSCTEFVTEEEYKDAVIQKERFEKIIHQYNRESQERFSERMRDNPIFTDDELYYSAEARCKCGSGLAYPKDCGPSHYWECAEILKGTADKNVIHTERLPFTFFDLKGEGSYKASSTRPRSNVNKNERDDK